MRRKILIAVGVAAAVLLGVRIWHVNATAGLNYPVETYAQDEWLPLEGAFAEYATENTDGYSIRVTGVRRMSAEQYLEQYGRDEAAGAEYLDKMSYAGAKSEALYVVLDIELRNDKTASSERGYLDSWGWYLSDLKDPTRYIRVDGDLLLCTTPQIKGRTGASQKLSIKPGTTFQLHVPFSCGEAECSFPASVDQYCYPKPNAGKYTFIVTKAPVRKVVELDVK